jgi:orotate phosphoribosyltransferase
MKDVTKNGDEEPFILKFDTILSHPKLFDDYSLIIETQTKNSNLEFSKICAITPSSIPYATNIATSLGKGLLFVTDTGNNHDEKNDIKNIKVNGGMNIDDNILLIDTIASDDYFLNNVIQKITKYGGNVGGVIIIFDKQEGEYINIVTQKIKTIPIINIYEMVMSLENNNIIDVFSSERIRFFCEKQMKKNIIKFC